MSRVTSQVASLPASERPDRLQRIPWVPIAVFATISFGLAWLTVLPLWVMEPNSSAYLVLAGALPTVMMFCPLIATLFVVFVMKTPARNRLQFLGIWPLRPAKRVVWFIVTMTIAPAVFVFASLGVSVLFEWTQLDVVNFSGFQAMLDEPLDDTLLRPVVLTQLAFIPFAAIFNAIPAFGEEIGWRGWLLVTLRPAGIWPAMLLSGAIWGVWHAPVILLGHNFNQPNIWGLGLMVVGSMAWGVFFGWLRLRSGSVWPAVIGHGALNASGGLVLLLTAADSSMEMALVSPFGVSGWIVLALVITLLKVTGQFRHEPHLTPKRAPRTADSIDTVKSPNEGR